MPKRNKALADEMRRRAKQYVADQRKQEWEDRLFNHGFMRALRWRQAHGTGILEKPDSKQDREQSPHDREKAKHD